MDTDSKDFWKTICRVGVGEERKTSIPLKIIREDGSISKDITLVLNKWRDSFSKLLNPVNQNINECEQRVITGISADNEAILNNEILVDEVKGMMKTMKNNKAYGEDGLPAEVLKNDILLGLLTKLFNKCFIFGVVSNVWKKNIIQLIPKSSTTYIRDTLNYRGITITSIVYQMHCSNLNRRLTLWDAHNSIISDA